MPFDCGVAAAGHIAASVYLSERAASAPGSAASPRHDGGSADATVVEYAINDHPPNRLPDQRREIEIIHGRRV